MSCGGESAGAMTLNRPPSRALATHANSKHYQTLGIRRAMLHL